MTSVLIVDDHQCFAECLALRLETCERYEVAAICKNGAEALAVVDARPDPIDVFICDLYIPGDALGETIRSLRERARAARIVCVTSSTGLDDERLALGSGADAVVRKHASIEGILAACRGEAGEGEPRKTFAPLSPRKIDVLRGVIKGRTNKEIGRDLGISDETVESHLKSIRIKTGVSRRPELIEWARRNGVWIES